jgi:hypothetical protein
VWCLMFVQQGRLPGSIPAGVRLGARWYGPRARWWRPRRYCARVSGCRTPVPASSVVCGPSPLPRVDVERRLEGYREALTSLRAAPPATAVVSPATALTAAFVQKAVEEEIVLTEFQSRLAPGRRDVRLRPSPTLAVC